MNTKALFRHGVRRGFHLPQHLTQKRWVRLKQTNNGMLRPSVYKSIYQHVKQAPDLDFVEIGGAHGASSIAIAMGFRDSGKQSHVVIAEKCEGGSRDRYGRYEDNYAILTQNLLRSGLRAHMHLYAHGMTDATAGLIKALIGTRQIAGFMHDADGWVDRDFRHFWPLTVPGGLIIIDDYPVSENTDQEKKRRTFHLLNQIIDWGLFEPRQRVGDTIFGTKPLAASATPPDWERAVVGLASDTDPAPATRLVQIPK